MIGSLLLINTLDSIAKFSIILVESDTNTITIGALLLMNLQPEINMFNMFVSVKTIAPILCTNLLS